MQLDSILKKAKRLGLNIGDGTNPSESLNLIANQLGIQTDDLSVLENALDDRLQSESNTPLESVNNYSQGYSPNMHNRFGEREYNKARNENGSYNKNYYSDREKELKNRLNEAKEEKEKTTKEVEDKEKNNENNNQENEKTTRTVNKNKIDNLRDNANILKNQANIAGNKIDGLKSNAYRAAHPIESAKNNIKAKAKDAAKEGSKKAVKAVGKAIKAVGSAIIKFIMANPWILIFIIAFFLIMLIFMAAMAGSDEDENSLFCEDISLNSSQLTQVTFSEKLIEAANADSRYQVFANNADTIYNLATSGDNPINPELVVIRAAVEGFSPGGSTNNYWGLGCYNTNSSACLKYSSFSDGVEAYIENIKRYESVTDMLSKYAYIGTYWYNPGSSGLGGCYYFPYIKEFMSETRAAEVEAICSKGSCNSSGYGNCVATTEEDQEAYTKYQMKRMLEFRETIFGIGADECVNPGGEMHEGNCQIFAQGDPRWSGDYLLGSYSTTMRGAGCAVTSIAMGITCFNAQSTSDFTAGTFNQHLRLYGCSPNSALMQWGCGAITSIAPSVHFETSVNIAGSGAINMINQYNDGNHFIIIGGYTDRGTTHYTLFLNWNNESQYSCLDPAIGSKNTRDASKIFQVVVYRVG